MTGCMEPVFSDNGGYKRIYLDLPGMGKSESAEWIKSSDDILDIVISFIEKVIPNENFLLAGQSYGGYLSRGIIHKMEDRIDGVLLICPLIIPEFKKRNVEEHAVLEKDSEFLSKLTIEETEDFNLVVQNRKTYERFKNELVCDVDDRFLENLQQSAYSLSFDVDKLNKKVYKPTLILLGKQDDCVGYKDAWNILGNFPRATFAILDKAGHCLQIEQESLFNSLIDDWLVRVSES
jgi:pimeloyl-ACP methyl ester carboxylesterase